MDHIGDGADTVAGVEHVDALRGIRHADGNPVSFADTHGEKGLRRQLNPGDELLIRRLLALELIGNVAWILSRGILHHFKNSLFRVLNRFRHITVKIQPGGR